jgi:hypothetical protein
MRTSSLPIRAFLKVGRSLETLCNGFGRHSSPDSRSPLELKPGNRNDQYCHDVESPERAVVNLQLLSRSLCEF